MRQIGLVACQPRPFRITTKADAKAAANMPDLVKRDFTADRPGVKFGGDLAAAHHRAKRLTDAVQQLEKQLSQTLGHRAWSEAGLDGPADHDQLTSRITELEQAIIDLREELEQRDQDLAAARGANRELMTQINTSRSQT